MRGWGLGDWQLGDCRLHFVLPTSSVILRDCRRHFVVPTSQMGSLPKAFQTITTCSFCFFVPRLFTKASFRHSLETKKPPICMGGFVACLGASLEEFAGDVRAILEVNFNSPEIRGTIKIVN